jgi:hypothetical protein
LFFEEIVKISSDLKNTQVSQEELDRAQNPRIANLMTSMTLNGFWMHWLDCSGVGKAERQRPEQPGLTKNARSEHVECAAGLSCPALVQRKPFVGPQ